MEGKVTLKTNGTLVLTSFCRFFFSNWDLGAFRETESREVLHECLRIFQKNGKEDWSLAKIMYNLGTSYLRSNDYVEAENFSRKSMEIFAKVKGPQHKAITIPMLPLAVTLHHLGRYEEAEKLALEALQIRENAFGKDSGHAGKPLLLAFKSGNGVNCD